MHSYHDIHHLMQTIVPAVAISTTSVGTYILSQLSGTTHIPLGEAAAGFIFVAGLVIYIDRKIRGLDAGQEASKKAVQELTNNQNTLIQNQRVIMDNVKELNANLAGRPCQKPGTNECPMVL